MVSYQAEHSDWYKTSLTKLIYKLSHFLIWKRTEKQQQILIDHELIKLALNYVNNDVFSRATIQHYC